MNSNTGEIPKKSTSSSFDRATNSWTVNLETSEGESSECESNEVSLLEFNSTTSSFLENIDNYIYMFETLKKDKIGLLWCHSHVELRLIEVEVD